jgi:hypothetical protein
LSACGIKEKAAALIQVRSKETKMTDDRTFERKVMSRAEREARKSFRSIEAEKAITHHGKAQRHFYENRERLKAERLAREAETGGAKKVR